jgi:Mg2+/citrate symporter
MTTARRRRQRVKRDAVIVTFALTMGAVEILFLGARPSVFTFLIGLLVSPLVLRYDEARREDDAA